MKEAFCVALLMLSSCTEILRLKAADSPGPEADHIRGWIGYRTLRRPGRPRRSLGWRNMSAWLANWEQGW